MDYSTYKEFMQHNATSAIVPSAKEKGRIIFLDYLRAVACLLVVFGHVYCMGYNGHEAITPYVPSVTQNIFGPDAIMRNIFSVPSVQLTRKFGINVGALGVALFFLISGFVILRALERETPCQFIIRRIFRIYPVCLAAMFVLGGVTAWYCHITNTVSPHSWQSMLASGLVLNGFLHKLDTTPVLWSLDIELYFYLFMAGLAARGKLGFNGILGLSLFCLVFTLGANLHAVQSFLSPLAASLCHQLSFVTLEMTFLLVGAMFYRMTEVPDKRRGLAYVATAIAIFVITRHGYILLFGDSGGVDYPDGAWACLIFASAYRSGMHWRWIKPLRWFGDISYPLYLVHIPLAWIALAWFAGQGWGMVGAGAGAGIVIVGVAWLLHVTVETHARRFGAKLAHVIGRKSESTICTDKPEEKTGFYLVS